jgi:hypothetical protein
MTVKGQQIESSVGGTNVVFRPFEIPGSREVDGYVFPLALELSTTPENILTIDTAANAIRDVAEKGIITDLLNKHGALLIRGVHDVSAKTFSTLIHASEEGRGRKPYEQVGFSGSRTVIDKEVFSASEAPPHVRIGQHNEVLIQTRAILSTSTNDTQNAIHTRFPANIHFYCVKKAPKGGR